MLKKMFPTIWVVLLGLCLPSLAQLKVDGQKAKSYVAYLASDRLKGRDTSTPEFYQTSMWIAAKFREWGLKPAGENNTYIQRFPFAYYKNSSEYPKLKIDDKEFDARLQDFRILRYSGGGKIKGEIVFVGYGISSPEKGLDEYAGIDVKGKVVLAMSSCPNDDRQKWGKESSDSTKAKVAFDHGARGILLFLNPKEEDRSRPYYGRLPRGSYHEGFIVAGLSDRVAQFILQREDEDFRAFMTRLRKMQRDIDKDLKPQSYATGRTAELEVKVIYDPEREGRNVLGKIPGTDPQVGDEVIVLGAHMDHIGVNYGLIYNGADDNASGTSLVMEIARVMMANKVKPRRTILFACWGGEEHGLLGSKYYAKHPTLPIEKTVLNLNMDMVGRGSTLNFGGIYYAPRVWQIIKAKLSQEELKFIHPNRGGPGGSDHTPFLTRGVPAFFLISGPWNAHPDYHQPGDDAQKINAELLGKIGQFAYDSALLIADYEGNLLQENRRSLYIHRYAPVVDLNPIPYHENFTELDSLINNEWVDIQLVTIPLDTTVEFPMRMISLVKGLDAAAEETKERGGMGVMARIFSSRRQKASPLFGIHGAQAINCNLNWLRIANKLGAKFILLDGKDGVWISAADTLTSAGREAIKSMNEMKMLIVLKNLPQQTVLEVLGASEKPIIVADASVGNKRFGSIHLSEEAIKRIREKQGLIALAYNFEEDLEPLVEEITFLKDSIGIDYVGLYPHLPSEAGIAALDKMLRLTVALQEQGYKQADIEKILGRNFQRLREKVSPPERRRRMRRY